MRRRRLPRPVHASLCLLAILAALAAVRLVSGVPLDLRAESALRKSERRQLLQKGELEARWDRAGQVYMAVRLEDGSLRVFRSYCVNDVSYNSRGYSQPAKRGAVNRYTDCDIVGDGDVPWDGSAFLCSFYDVVNGHFQSVTELHILLSNADPAVRRAGFRCVSLSEREGKAPFRQTWTAEAERLTPGLFDLTLSMRRDSAEEINDLRWEALVAIGAGGYPIRGDVALEGEVTLYDAEGKELSRQPIAFFRQEDESKEGSEEHGA